MPAQRRKRSSRPYYYLLLKGNYYQVMLRSKYNGNRLEYFTGVRTLPEFWDETEENDNGLIPKGKDVALLGKMELAGITRDLQTVRITKARLSGIKAMAIQMLADPKNAPAPDKIKEQLNEKYNTSRVKAEEKKISLYDLIDRFISGEIKAKGEDRSERTRNGYVYFKKHLQDFEAAKHYPVNFDTITLDFFYKYIDYLKKDIPLQQDPKKKGLKRNTIAKDINLLKAVLNVAVYMPGNMVTVMDYKNPEFVFSEEETDNVYLTEKEVIKLYNHDFSDNKRLEQIRDLFVFGCFTGLRFSDYSNVQPENIREIDGELFIAMNTQKTGEHVVIPCNPIILKIFDRYQRNNNRLPRAVSNQKFNAYVKEACEKAMLTETGRLSTELKKPLHECVSSHTARRSFATNLYLQGYPTIEIMKITGHKTEKAFLKYIKVTKLDAAKRLSEHIKKNWSEKILRVA